MPDVFYQFSGVPVNPASHAARLAVIYPLAGRRTQDGSDAVMLRAGLGVLLDYRNALVGLRDAGWGIFKEHPKLLQKMRNCPPSMFVTGDVDECICPCDHVWFCPWCYGRWLKDAFKRVADAMQPSDRLVWMVGRFYERFDCNIRKKLQAHRRTAGSFLTVNKCKGAVMSLTAEPYTRKEKKRLRVSYRYVILLSPGQKLHLSSEKWDGRTISKPTKMKLASVFSRALRYPEFLFRGGPEDVVSILNARHGLRLSEFYGCLRASLEPEKAPEEDTGEEIDTPPVTDCSGGIRRD